MLSVASDDDVPIILASQESVVVSATTGRWGFNRCLSADTRKSVTVLPNVFNSVDFIAAIDGDGDSNRNRVFPAVLSAACLAVGMHQDVPH